ncbi:MAG TPA: cytochrome c [Chloroflexota bacterium]
MIGRQSSARSQKSSVITHRSSVLRAESCALSAPGTQDSGLRTQHFSSGTIRTLIGCFLLGLALLTVTGCGEMYRQPAARPETPPRLVPAVGSVPVTGEEPVYPGVDGKDLKNPVSNDQASFARGKNLFNTFCIPCHGLQGKGNGPVASAYSPQPADLTAARVQGLTDGDIFLRITNGFSTMPYFRKQLQPNERWDIVNYVRSFKQ